MNIQQLHDEKTNLVEYELSTGSTSSRKTYNSIISNFLSWCTEQQIQEVTPNNYYHILNQYKTHLIERPQTYTTRSGNTITKKKQLSQYTINQYMKKLLYFLRHCGIETPIEPKLYRGAYVPKERKWIDYNEYLQLREYTPDTRTQIIMDLMFKCGLRVNEVVNITLEQYQDAPLTPNGYKKICILGKGNKKRQVPIPPEVCILIDKYLWKEHTGTTYLIGSKRKGNDTPLSTNQIRSILKNVCRQCDHVENTTYTQKVTPHVLRHSYAVHLIRKGVPLNVVQKLLGHSKIDITSIYTQIDSDTAISEIDSLLLFQ